MRLEKQDEFCLFNADKECLATVKTLFILRKIKEIKNMLRFEFCGHEYRAKINTSHGVTTWKDVKAFDSNGNEIHSAIVKTHILSAYRQRRSCSDFS